MDDKIVKEHIANKLLKETVIIPNHAERTESEQFNLTKKKLKEDNHNECWICGSKDDLNVHHFCLEWCFEENADFDKLKEVCEIFDIYGYSKQMKDIPITSVDDIRNMMVLCRKHHMDYSNGCKNGIHDISFPVWLYQKICKNITETIPENIDNKKNNIKSDENEID